MGSIHGDMICLGRVISPGPQKYYVEGLKCGTRKIMSLGHINKKEGILHTSCRYHMDHINKDLYRHWAAMKSRCGSKTLNKLGSNRCYLEKNITCSEFDVYIDFQRSMEKSYIEHVAKYGKRNTTLDRINPDEGYSTENCRWATYEEQANHLATNVDFYAISPTGIQTLEHNYSKFAREHDLIATNILKVFKGERKHVNGWKFKRINKNENNSVTTIPDECKGVAST